MTTLVRPGVPDGGIQASDKSMRRTLSCFEGLRMRWNLSSNAQAFDK
jgi:hypothetical protein